ncbi:S-layer homology domain-containing protein [Paenibacillus sp. GSMTC-2017]|uniref:S-layer homology domain-containing protein n=1 Tax=Paenibacillus sp. GSMTC-2017 TaxID=2794350 RepID=UPI001E4A72AD|nr:S-layer homology domain-containing protein [Paenibacillus sp. GSMTC-2017]
MISMFIPFALAVTLVFPALATTTYAAEYTELDMYFPIDIEEHWAYDELDNFVNADLLKGYKDFEGTVTVKPDQSITRAEFVALLVRALALKSEETGKTFTDVSKDKWYYEPIQIASSLGVVNGVSESKFDPNKRINRGDIATMVVRAFEKSVSFEQELGELYFNDVPDYYAMESIAKAFEAGIVNGVTEDEYRPFANAKRAEAVVMLQRALDLQRGNLPTDAELFERIIKSDTESTEAINQNKLDQLDAIYKSHFTGYSLAISNDYGNELIELASQDYSLTIQKVSDEHLTVLDKTDRFAIIESTQGSYTLTAKQNGNTSTKTVSSDGLYLLKKMDDNSWKIYMHYLNEEQQQ